jgi:hypothetical protein
VATPGQNITSYQDTGLTAGTTYFYQVVAYNWLAIPAVRTRQARRPHDGDHGSDLTEQSGGDGRVHRPRSILSWTDGSSSETGFRGPAGRRGALELMPSVSTLGLNITSYQDTWADGWRDLLLSGRCLQFSR